jgi:3-hydroxyisobutyrate dehydrogenase-like beta-hydroxyacid dehydrogenase
VSRQDRTKTVGFVGMGVMGSGVAANVLDGPAAVARAAAKTVCMVETTVQAESVIVGKGGIVEAAEKGDIHLCMSTIDPPAVKRMHGVLAERGVAMFDAPVRSAK